MAKIQKCTPGMYLSTHQYDDMSFYVWDAFLHDHSKIVEDYDLYQKLTPRMQTQLIGTIFKDFIRRFDHLLSPCELGFRNELVI